jgi:hypothetical protein
MNIMNIKTANCSLYSGFVWTLILTVIVLLSKRSKPEIVHYDGNANFSNIAISSELISIPGRLGLLWTSTRDRVLRKYNLPLNNYHRYGLQFNVNNNYSQFLFILLAGDVATNPGPRSSIERLYLNSRSLKAFVEMDDKPSKVCKIDVFQQLVYSGDYDVVCVCETWLNDSVLDSELLAGYSIFRRDRLGRTGGGVLVAVKDTIRTKRRYDLERNNVEFVVVELFQENMKSILLYTFYLSSKFFVGFHTTTKFIT